MAKTKRAERKTSIGAALRSLGPGLVTGAADDDPSGIATYSQAGAQFGYGLLWTVFLTTPFMIAIQLVSAYIGRVTGKGLAANVKELAPRWSVLLLVSLLVAANTFNIAADIAAMGEALSLVIYNGRARLAFSSLFVGPFPCVQSSHANKASTCLITTPLPTAIFTSVYKEPATASLGRRTLLHPLHGSRRGQHALKRTRERPMQLS